MLEAIILQPPPSGRFHFGEYTEDPNVPLSHTATLLHSDVLFGAFISNLAFRYPDQVNKFHDHFQEGRLKLSSGFYCIDDQDKGSYTYLLPKPLSLETKPPPKGDPKFFKHIRFISTGVWSSGIKPEDWVHDPNIAITGSGIVAFGSELPGDGALGAYPLYHVMDTPKVAVRTAPAAQAAERPRGRAVPTEQTNANTGKHYYQSDLTLEANSHYQVQWYFLLYQQNLEAADQAIVDEVLAGIRLSGIGGERSTGAGHIQAIERQPFGEFIQQDEQAAYRMALSLTVPRDDDEWHAFQLYQAKKRGGRCVSGHDGRLPVMQMLQEGAIQQQAINGRAVELAKQQLRGGFNLSLPLPKTLAPNL